MKITIKLDPLMILLLVAFLAATTGMTLRLPNLRPTVIAPSDTIRAPTKAITTITKHLTSRTYTVKKFITILIN